MLIYSRRPFLLGVFLGMGGEGERKRSRVGKGEEKQIVGLEVARVCDKTRKGLVYLV